MKSISVINKMYKETSRCTFSVVFLLVLISGCNIQKNELPGSFSRDNYSNVLDVKNTPRQPVDWKSFCFADQGAWFGFAFPDNGEPAFTGPFMMTTGRWMSDSFLKLNFLDENHNPIQYTSSKSTFYPGKLVQESDYGDFQTTMSLIFISSEQVLVQVSFKGRYKGNIHARWIGSIFETEGKIISEYQEIKIAGNQLQTEFRLAFSDKNKIENIDITDTAYSVTYSAIKLPLEKSLSVLISFNDERTHQKKNSLLPQEVFDNSTRIFAENQQRWDNYLDKALQTTELWGADTEIQRIAVKSVQTLISNWRCAYGSLKHDGLFPSYAVNYFNGFWAWDSWKHAVALATFAPDLAKNQVRAMYDYQNSAGMIADCIYADSTENNWLNTKPPLSGWAIWAVFERTGDTAFLKEMFPKLVKYHKWWYQYRDLNKNGLCEYGSSDGSLVAAKWESGMDNAIRFDSSSIVKIDEKNYAFSQESVDLNSYLYAEKMQISEMAKLLEKPNMSENYVKEAQKLKSIIEEKMFDHETGYFYDINLSSETIVPKQGSEGWTPLFVNLASEEKAKRVVGIMLDTNKFNTYIPFPTAPHDNPEFSRGYWRGPIWLDQVYFAITALQNYGYNNEARYLTNNVFNRLQGIKLQEPIRENYWPLTGEGMRVNHFSWSAAHLLLLFQQ